MASVSAPDSGFQPCLNSCSDFLQWWMMTSKCKPDITFPPHLTFSQRCFLHSNRNPSGDIDPVSKDKVKNEQEKCLILTSGLPLIIHTGIPHKIKVLHMLMEAGKMAQWLRALIALAEVDLGSIPNTHMLTYNHCNSRSLLLLASEGTRHACGTHLYAGKTLVHIK